MAEKKITRKVILKAPAKEEVVKETKEREAVTVAKIEETGSPRGEAGRTRKACFFCQSKTGPSYTDIQVLRRFTTDRAKIVARARSGVCSRHQRAVTRHIKYARHLALFPFVPQV